MVRTNGTPPYHCYRATNATDARIGWIPTLPDPPYRSDKWRRQRKFATAVPNQAASAQCYHYPDIEAKRLLYGLLKGSSNYDDLIDQFTGRTQIGWVEVLLIRKWCALPMSNRSCTAYPLLDQLRI
jgi:hypothetical protein